MLKKMFLIIAVFTMAVFANISFAGHEEWSPVSAGPITTWTAPLCGKGKLVAQPFFFYNRTRGTFNSDGHYDPLAQGNKKYQFQQQFFLQYGLTDNLEVDAQALYQENFIRQDGRNANADGFGDSYLFLRDCLIEEKEAIPHITGLLSLKFPTGKYEKADPDKLGADLMGATSGGGSYDYGFGVIITKKLKPFIFHADWLYSFPLETKVDGIETKYARYLNYDFGLEYFFGKNINLILEFNGFLQGDKKQSGSRIAGIDISYLTAGTGIGWSNEKVQSLLSYQRTIAGTNTDVNDSVILTFIYTF